MAAAEAEEVFVARALARIFRGALVLTAVGTLAALALKGGRWGIGFAVGAAASGLNFYWLHRLVEGLAPGGGRRPRKRLLVLLATRYLLLGGAGYAIVKLFGLSLAATLLGLFVPAAAILVEIVYELTHART